MVCSIAIKCANALTTEASGNRSFRLSNEPADLISTPSFIFSDKSPKQEPRCNARYNREHYLGLLSRKSKRICCYPVSNQPFIFICTFLFGCNRQSFYIPQQSKCALHDSGQCPHDSSLCSHDSKPCLHQGFFILK